MKKILLTIILSLFLCFPAYAGSIDTSSSTAQTFIGIVRTDLNELTAAFWTDAELITWIDEAITEIVNQTRCLEATVEDVTLASSDYDYTLSSSFLDVEMALYDSGDDSRGIQIYALDRTNLNDIGHVVETGRPKKYALWNDQIIVWPIPDSTISGTTIHVYYIPMPSGVTTSTSPIETPAYFDPAITDYVKAKAYLKDNRINLANTFMGYFNSRIQTYLVNVVNRGVEKEIK